MVKIGLFDKNLKFQEYDTGEIELVQTNNNGSIKRYLAYWKNIRELKESLEDLEAHF